MKINQKLHSVPQLSDFDIEEPLGRGSNSYVYRAYCRKQNKHVAIKVIDKRNGRKVQQEIQLQEQSKHANIIEIINSFHDEENHYIVLEYCAGGELYTYLKKKKNISEEEATSILLQLAQATEIMHSKRIIHRDLKLGNILLTASSSLKVGDFGLAEKSNSRNIVLPQPSDLGQGKNIHKKEGPNVGAIIHSSQNGKKVNSVFKNVGTPSYWAPETIRDSQYTFKTDIWALGCIYFAILVGRLPFEGSTDDELFQKIISNDFSIPKNISAFSNGLIRSMLAPVKDRRPSAENIIKAIKEKAYRLHPTRSSSLCTRVLAHAKSRHELNSILSMKGRRTEYREGSKKANFTSLLSPANALTMSKAVIPMVNNTSPKICIWNKVELEHDVKNASTASSEGAAYYYSELKEISSNKKNFNFEI